MSEISRRSFVGWLSAIGAVLGLRRGVPEAMAATGGVTPADGTGQDRGDALDVALLVALASAVLPGELGSDRLERAGRSFGRWAGAFRPDAEMLHGYGTAVITRTRESPVPRWRAQLAALDTAARTTHGKSFVTLAASSRQELVRQVLTADKSARIAAPGSASHVATALLSHFYASGEATDLCYEAQIAPNRCRPLVNAARQPLPLAPRSRT